MKTRLHPAIPILLGSLLLPGTALTAPVVRATLEDSLVTDESPVGTANEGDVIEYRAVITNTGDTTATGVEFFATLDPKVRLAEGSENISPLALNDSYNAVGNTPLKVGVAAGAGPEVVVSGSVFDNDREFLGDGFEFDPTYVPAASHGDLTFKPDGTFTYLPHAGFEGTDTFSYRIRDASGLTGTATVTIQVSTPVWYVDFQAGAGGDGRATSPLHSLAGLNNGTVPDEAGDVIYLHPGGVYEGGLVLLDGQRLVGGGVPLEVNGHLLVEAGLSPILSHTSTTLVLAQDNTVEGLNLLSTGGHALTGSSFGNLRADLAGISAVAGAALKLDTGTADLRAQSLSATSVPGTSSAVQISSVAGNIEITGTTTANSPAATAISISDSSARISFGDVVVMSRGATGVSINSCTGSSIDFGNVTVSNPNFAAGYGILIRNGSAPVTFASTTISSTVQSAATADGNTDGFPDSDGSGDAIFISSHSGTVTINGGTLSNLACDGIDIRNSANLVVSGLTITDVGLSSANPATVDSAGIFVRNLSGILSVKDTTIRHFHGALDEGLGSAGHQERGISMRNHDVSFTQVRLDNVDMENAPGQGLEGSDGFEAVFSGNVSGTVKIFNGCSFKHLSDGEGVQILHTGSGNLDVEIADSIFSDAVQWDPDDNPATAKLGGFGGIDFSAEGVAVCRVHVKDCQFHDLCLGNFNAGIVNLRARGNSSCSFLFTGNVMDGDAMDNGAGRIGLNITAGDAGDLQPFASPRKFDVLIENNLIDDTDDDAFTVDVRGSALSNGAVGNVVVRNNTIGSAAAAARRSRVEGARIRVRDALPKTVNVVVSGNSIRNHGDSVGDGVLEVTSEHPACLVNARISGNTFQNDSVTVGAPAFFADTRPGGWMNLDLQGNVANASSNIDPVEYLINNGGTVLMKGNGSGPVSAVDVQLLNPGGGGLALIGAGITQFNNNMTVPEAIAPAPPALPLISGYFDAPDAGPDPESPEVVIETKSPIPSGGRTSDALRAEDLEPVVAEARARWMATGLSEEQIGLLGSVVIEVADLHGLHLGSSRPGLIQLDSDAATRGWYLGDPSGSGLDFTEGNDGRLMALPAGPAEQRMDLLTTVMHELGHQLGLGDLYDPERRGDLMFGYLVPGERRLPRMGQAAGAMPDGRSRDEFLLSPFVIGDLPPGKSVTIVFRTDVDFAVGSEITLQGVVSGGNFADVSTDDPDAEGDDDPTETPYQGNRSPVLLVGEDTLQAFVGDTLTNSGTWSDEDSDQVVALSADVGEIVRNCDGTWSWSMTAAAATPAPVTVTITANDGSGLSNATAQATFSYSIARRSQEIEFDPPGTQSAPVPLELGATATSGLQVTFVVTSGAEIASLSEDGVTLTFTGAGSVTVEARQTGDGTWAPAEPVTHTFLVEKAVQEIVFELPETTSHRASIELVASGGDSDEPVTFAVQSGPASIGEGVLTFSGTGAIEIVANQSGNELYEAADPVVRTITSTNAAPVITLAGSPLELVIEETETASASGSVSDADGEPLVITSTSGGDPFGVVIQTPEGWEWTYPSAEPGQYTVRVTATDTLGESTSVEFDLVVSENPYLKWAAENGVSGDLSGIDDDFDGDGLANILEFAFGTDPTVVSPHLLEAPVVDGVRELSRRGQPIQEITNTSAAPVVKVLLMRRASHSEDGLSYFVEFSWNLSAWETSTAIPEVLWTDGDFELVSVPYPFFLSDGRKARFFRVRVEYEAP